jgi:phosphoglycerol transferase MdoB-like AlkP superfamily enzyme
VLVVLAVIKTWLMRGFSIGAWNPVGAVAFETAIVVLLLGIVDLIPPRRWYWLDFAAYTLISALLFVMTVYVHFYAQLFDPHMMAMAGQVGTVADTIGQLIKPIYILFFIDLPVLAWWVVAMRKQARRQRERLAQLGEDASPRRSRRVIQPRSRSLKVAITTAVAGVVLVGQLVTAMQVPSYVDGVAIAKSRGLAVAQAAVFLPRAADANADDASADIVAPGVRVASTSTTASVVSTASQTPSGKAAARIERIRGATEGSRITTFSPGAYKGKNVIIIQVEALNGMVMQKKIDGKEITPNLNKLLGESWYFPNTYSETGIGNTADAEFIVNSSLYAPRAQAAPVAYADRKVPALPRLLNAIGYDTFTMHANRVTYWNRKELYAALGFKKYYDAPYFHWTDIMGFGPSDEILASKAMIVAKAEEASGTPFYGQLITLSSHTPFEYIPQNRRPLKTPSEYRGSLTGNYISAESYTDMALGKLIDQLKATPIWDKSIIIIYGDHTAMLDNTLDGTDAKATRALLGRDYGPQDRQRIPLIIHLPGQDKPVVDQSVVGQVDIMPTVADLLGLDLTQVPHMGRSVFVKSNALVPFNSYLPGGSFVNDRLLFMPGLGFDDGKSVNIADGSGATPNKQDESDYERMLQLTKLSDRWVMGLPKRKDAASLGEAWIPNNEARRAAAPLGAAQRGNGSD